MVKRLAIPDANRGREDDIANARTLELLATTSQSPGLFDPSWAPPYATVGIANDEHEERLVRQLRYRVHIHEQGRRPDGVDWDRTELTDPLDECSYLWFARDGGNIVGTLTQTIIGPAFDLSRLPAALELHRFRRTIDRPLGFSSRAAIAPDYRCTWVLPSLARYSYVHGREVGGRFDFMVTNPGLVRMFERLGYVRYTATAIHVSDDVGLLIPMVLAATDHEHLRKVRSACLSAASHFDARPEWGAWLRATHPMIGVYYPSDHRSAQSAAMLAERTRLPRNIALEMCALSFVHHFPAGTALRRPGDRVTSAFFAQEGDLSTSWADAGKEPTARYAPDGVAFSRVAIRCETNAVVLCVPHWAVMRLKEGYPEHRTRLEQFLDEGIWACDRTPRRARS